MPIHTDTGTGTGFVVSSDGLVITANHVVEGAGSIQAGYSSGLVNLRVVDIAAQYDLALLRLEKVGKEVAMPLAGTYRDGDSVLAYGYPGNSGGPLIGRCGVVGIVVSMSDSASLSDYMGVVSEQGISYAVSIKTAAKAFDLKLDN